MVFRPVRMMRSAGEISSGVVKRRNSMITEAVSAVFHPSTRA